MKKLMIAAAAAMCLGTMLWAGTNDWVAPIQVTQVATSIRLTSINIQTPTNGVLIVGVSWQWEDSAGKPVRSGYTRLSEAEIRAALASTGTGITVELFRQLFTAIAAAKAVEP